MSRRGGGRGLAELAADFGHRLPAPPPPPRRVPAEAGPFTGPPSRRGRAARGSGWCAVPAPLATYRMISGQTPGVWPLIAGAPLPPAGAAWGIDYLTGGAFYAGPLDWVADPAVPVTNPNLFVAGHPGMGKSSGVKTFCLRMLPYGYRTLVLGDVKDEYEPLCTALGVAPHAVGPGLPARINPLDFGPLGGDWAALSRAEAGRRAALVFARWLVLLRGLSGAQGVPFGATAENDVGAALREYTGYTAGAGRLRPVTIPQLWHTLCTPSRDLVAACRYAGTQAFLDGTRAVRDALGTLVHGHLAGMFDAPTTIDVNWRAPIQSLSLSRLSALGDQAVAVALTCVNSWGRAMTEERRPGDLRIIVRDECWRQMRLGLGAVQSLDADLRLSRAEGAIQVVVAHKPSDMLTVGDAGSQAVAIAKDLLHLCGTKVLYGQDAKVGEELAALLGLPPMAEQIITDWCRAGRGRSLWAVGPLYAKVQAIRTPAEQALTETDTDAGDAGAGRG